MSTTTLPRACRAKDPTRCRVHGISWDDGKNFDAWMDENRQAAQQRLTMGLVAGIRRPVRNTVEFTDEEKQALTDFSAFESTPINGYFYRPEFRDALHADDKYAYPDYWRGERLADSTEARQQHLKEFLRQIEVLENATSRNRFSKPVTVYRGEGINWDQGSAAEYVAKNYPVGAVFSRASFMSTSTNPAVAAQFSSIDWAGGPSGDGVDRGLIFEMRTTQGAVMREHAQYAVEDEILLPREKQFRVVEIKRETFKKTSIDMGHLIMDKDGRTGEAIVVVLDEI